MRWPGVALLLLLHTPLLALNLEVSSPDQVSSWKERQWGSDDLRIWSGVGSRVDLNGPEFLADEHLTDDHVVDRGGVSTPRQRFVAPPMNPDESSIFCLYGAKPETSHSKASPSRPVAQIKTYGFVELNGYYEDSQFMGNDGPIWIVQERLRSIGLSPRVTRFGFNVNFPTITEINLGATLESDFAGDYADSPYAESRPMMRLRHAYIDISKNPVPKKTVGVKVGNTWSIISPLNPSVEPITMAWGLGNIWQRQPQVQLYFDQKLDHGKVGGAVAANRPMTGDSIYRATNISSAIDAGDASCMPMMEWECHFERKVDPFELYLSCSGLFGKEDYTGMTAKKIGGADYKVNGNVVNVDGIFGAAKATWGKLTLQGEIYAGENLDLFGTQLSSGLKYVRNDVTKVLTVLDSVKTRGGWVQFSFNPTKKLNLNWIYGIDDPEDWPTNVYRWNTAFVTSAFYFWYERLILSACVYHIHTALTTTVEPLEGNELTTSLRLLF